MPEEDRELLAIQSIIEALSSLEDKERSRVLEYVLKRLDMAAVQAPPSSRETAEPHAVPRTARPIADIRTLKEQKQPRSANEMAALVAYYLSELASEDERTETVNAQTLRRYFKMAGFRLPNKPTQTLPNAAAAGYLDGASRGEYRLNPVGYNLVVHGLPRSGDTSATPTRTRRKKDTRKKATRKKATRKKATKKKAVAKKSRRKPGSRR